MSGLIHFRAGDAVNNTPVSSAEPLPVADAGGAPYTGAVALTVGTSAAAGRGLAIVCTAAGAVSVTFPDASVLVFPVQTGLTVLPFKVTRVNTSGTTATATYANLG